MLTTDQIAAFQADGVLVVRGFLPLERAAAARDDVANHFRRPADGDGWRQALTTHTREAFHSSHDPTPLNDERLASIYEALSRNVRWYGDSELVIRPAGEASDWLGPNAPHLDFPIDMPLRPLIHHLLYLDTVATRGGAFMYWPASHLVSWDYFRREPADYLSRGSRAQVQTFELILGETQNAPVEFLGRPGDLLIWHPLLLHSASVNKSRTTRVSMIGRWGAKIPKTKPAFDFDRDIWSYYLR